MKNLNNLFFYILLYRFECPDFNAYDKEKCHFKGKSYEKSTYLEEDYNTDCITNGCVCPK